MSLNRWLLWIACVWFAIGSAGASAGGESVDGLLAEARLLARMPATKAASPTAQARVDRFLERAARAQALAEHGQMRAGRAQLAQLAALADAIESARPPLVTAAKGGPGSPGTVTGLVRDAVTLAPIAGVPVRAFGYTSSQPPSGPGIVPTANSAADGSYTLTLPPEKYTIRTLVFNLSQGATGYVGHMYSGISCPDSQVCPPYAGTVVTVPAGGSVPNTHMDLQRGGVVNGTVTRTSNSMPLQDVLVQAMNEIQVFPTGPVAATDAAGAYSLRGLAPGRYRIFTISNAGSGLMDEAYPNQPCAGNSDCVYVPSDWITVTAGGTTNGIDLGLDVAGSVSGTVTEAGTGAPVFEAIVSLLSEDGYTYEEARTDATGAYAFSQVRPGSYRLLASTGGFDINTGMQLPARHISVAYPNVVCGGVGTRSCDPIATGSPVVVAGPGSSVTGINFSLSRGGRVQGVVRRADLMTPIEGATVNVFSLATGYINFGLTDASGAFDVAGLPPGTYTLAADAREAGYALTTLAGQACNQHSGFATSCDVSPARFTITGTSTHTGADVNALRGGMVTGVIRDTTVDALMPNNRTRLEVFDTAGNLVDIRFATFDQPSGTTRYTVPGLAPGTYKGVFASSGLVGWIDTAFGGIPCPRGGCDQSVLPPIFATAGGTLSNIDGTMARGRLIRGRVTDGAGASIRLPAFDVDYVSQPIVTFNNAASNYAGFGQPDGRGDYFSRQGFTSGTTVYPSTAAMSSRLTATWGFGYVDENLGGQQCPFSSCGATTGTAITVTGADVNGVDFSLSRGASIAGVVTASIGSTPINGVTVYAYAGNGKIAGFDVTDALGNYKVRGLSAGTYFVSTQNQLGFLNEVYPNVACEPFCNPLIGTAVAASGIATTGGINFALDLAATVSGTVNGTNVPVEIYGAIGNLLRSTTSGAGGAYAFTGLAAGTYYVRTRNTTGQADELWMGEVCVGDACNVRRGTAVLLAAGETAPNRNLTLAAPGVITGQVTGPGGPQSGVMLQLLVGSGAVALTTTTNGTGNYTFSGLAAGSYRVVTRGTPGLIDIAYPSSPCPPACAGLNGSPIAVNAGATTPGINIMLQTAGYISGTVRTAALTPVVGALVQAYSTGSVQVPTAQIATNASGNYQIDGLPAGQFFVRTQNALGLVDQVFKAPPPNLQCSGFCDVASGTQIGVTAGSAIPIDPFTLAGGASISGRVTNAVGGSGIALGTVLAYDRGGNVAGVATTNASGDYTIGGLRLIDSTGMAAVYRLRTANLSGFVNQLYRGSGNISCSPTPCSNLFLGTAITVSGTPVAGINFALAAGSVISGTATDQFNNPLPTGTAVLYDSTGAQITTSPIDRGVWQFSGLANGTYYVLIQNNVGLVDQLYANVPCPGGACSITTLGTPIVLSGGAGGGGAIPKGAVVSKGGVATIDLKLGTGRTIAGTVREQGSNAPLAGVTVYFFNAAGTQVGQATTDGLGEYLSDGGFGAGTYYAATANGTVRGGGENILGAGYVNRLYSGQNCLLACNVTGGTPISVAANPVLGIDFTLGAAGAGITGTVRDAQNQPLEQTPVEIYGTDGRLAGTALTNSLGVYSVDGLPAGNYYARTRNNAGLQDRLYGQQLCAGACNPLLGTPIVVPAVAAITGIDINLSLLDGIFANGFEN